MSFLDLCLVFLVYLLLLMLSYSKTARFYAGPLPSTATMPPRKGHASKNPTEKKLEQQMLLQKNFFKFFNSVKKSRLCFFIAPSVWNAQLCPRAQEPRHFPTRSAWNQQMSASWLSWSALNLWKSMKPTKAFTQAY